MTSLNPQIRAFVRPFSVDLRPPVRFSGLIERLCASDSRKSDVTPGTGLIDDAAFGGSAQLAQATLDNMIQRYGYCEDSAREVITFLMRSRYR